MSGKPATAVKKIKPYPFAGIVELNAAKRNIEVIHITTEGFIAKLAAGIVSVGEHYQAGFEIPVSHKFITAQVRVMKTYDRSMDPKKHLVERMAEFRFENLTDAHKESIVTFLQAIGQK